MAAVVAQVVPGMANAATSVAVQSDGDVLVGGSAGTPHGGVPASSGFVVRLLANGSFDPSFGGSGLVRPAGLAPITQVAETADGHILALGGSLILLDRNGGRDTRFGSGAVAALPSAFTAESFVVETVGTVNPQLTSNGDILVPIIVGIAGTTATLCSPYNQTASSSWLALHLPPTASKRCSWLAYWASAGRPSSSCPANTSVAAHEQ